MAQRRAQARQQFADGERLFDIIVGAEIERGDLLGLAVARRQDEDRRGSEFARLGQHVLAVHVGQAEIEHDDIGRRIGDQPQRLAPGGGVQHLIARRLQRRAQEAQDLRLVVDDKHAKTAHAALLRDWPARRRPAIG